MIHVWLPSMLLARDREAEGFNRTVRAVEKSRYKIPSECNKVSIWIYYFEWVFYNLFLDTLYTQTWCDHTNQKQIPLVSMDNKICKIYYR